MNPHNNQRCVPKAAAHIIQPQPPSGMSLILAEKSSCFSTRELEGDEESSSFKDLEELISEREANLGDIR